MKGVPRLDPQEIAAHLRAFGDAFRSETFDAQDAHHRAECERAHGRLGCGAHGALRRDREPACSPPTSAPRWRSDSASTRLTTRAPRGAHERAPSRRRWLQRMACAVTLGATSSSTAGCELEAVGPEYPGGDYGDYPPDAYIATTDPVYFEGHASYWYGGRWYYREWRSLEPLRQGARRALPAKVASAAGATNVRSTPGPCRGSARGETHRPSLIGICGAAGAPLQLSIRGLVAEMPSPRRAASSAITEQPSSSRLPSRESHGPCSRSHARASRRGRAPSSAGGRARPRRLSSAACMRR